MNVKIAYIDADPPESKVRRTKTMTIKEARIYYETYLKDKVTMASLIHFSGYHYYHHSWLKEPVKTEAAHE